MAKEIERKFLVDKSMFENLKEFSKDHGMIVQGYLSTDPNHIVRIRYITLQEQFKAYLTVKGKNNGISRDEFEYEIPFNDALQMMALVPENLILGKARYIFMHENKKWEVDYFFNENVGLIIAEIELDSEDEEFDLPFWVGKEVTGDERYYNSNLVINPYSNW